MGSAPRVVSNVTEVATSLCLRGDKKVKLKLDFAESSVGKESACSAGDSPLIPRLERSPGEGKGYPLQYSGLENSMDWTVHGVAKSQTQLNDFLFHLNSNTESFSEYL